VATIRNVTHDNGQSATCSFRFDVTVAQVDWTDHVCSVERP